MKKISNIALWALTVFMLLAALVYMPSAASVLMLLFAVVALPLPRVRAFWQSKRIAGPLKAAILCTLFVVSVSLAPSDRTGTDTDKEADDPPPAAVPSESDKLVQAVKESIEEQVGEGEKITSVEMDGNNLVVSVHLDEASIPSGTGIGMDDLAESRFSSITDKILELDGYDDCWETITVDFGEIGSIQCGKADIEESGYGRFFSSTAVILQSSQSQPVEEPAKEKETYPEIAALFGTVVPDAETAVTSRNGTALHVKITTQLPSDTAPEGWENTLSALADALATAEEQKADYGASAVSAEIIAEDKSILASGFDGAVQFTKFEERDLEIVEVESKIDPEEIENNAGAILNEIDSRANQTASSDSSPTVYVSRRSNTIHSVSDCSGMTNYREMSRADADSKGYGYCPNCW